MKLNISVKKFRYLARSVLRKAKLRNDHPDREFNHVIQSLITTRNPVLFDVGAHRGESIKRFRGLFDNPEVHAFEPDTENFEYLRKFCEKLENTTINNVGVSESNGELVLYRNAKSSTSSFSPLNKNSDWVKLRCAERGISSDKFTEQEYKVDVIDLDSYVRKKHITRIDLLKIDTQTHEDKVLDGCKNTLKKGIIKVIEIEVIVGDVYNRSLNISDIEMRLLKFGYKFYGINRAGNLLNAPWVDFDMIYVHNTLL